MNYTKECTWNFRDENDYLKDQGGDGRVILRQISEKLTELHCPLQGLVARFLSWRFRTIWFCYQRDTKRKLCRLR
jgi:hypothetical protein